MLKMSRGSDRRAGNWIFSALPGCWKSIFASVPKLRRGQDSREWTLSGLSKAVPDLSLSSSSGFVKLL
jgi:hypothetical protein